MFTVSIGIESMKDARDWARSDRGHYRRLAEEAWARGVLIDEDPREPWCLCYSHTDADIDETLNIIQDALRATLQ
jgi:glutamate-1-semialdehyde 2,1-aminomutase